MASRTTPRKQRTQFGAEADQVILMMVSGLAEETIRQVCAERLKVPARSIDPLIAECKTRITLAAKYNRADELGKAITRLNDCYGKSSAIQDVKTCLQAQRELNKLLRLYQAPEIDPDAGDETEASETEAQARAHLAPLFKEGDSLPLPELARLAAQRIVTSNANH